MQATTTKQLMDQSKLFRVLFWGSIVCILVGIVLCSVFPFTSCYSKSYYSCYDYYSYYIYECYSGGASYCCASGYNYCGNSNYCIVKNYYPYTRACIGVLITGSSLLGLGGLLAIFVFIMFCNFRSKIKRGAYANLAYPYPPVNQPIYGNPVVIYPGQQNQPQLHVGNQINQSQNQ